MYVYIPPTLLPVEESALGKWGLQAGGAHAMSTVVLKPSSGCSWNCRAVWEAKSNLEETRSRGILTSNYRYSKRTSETALLIMQNKYLYFEKVLICKD